MVLPPGKEREVQLLEKIKENVSSGLRSWCVESEDENRVVGLRGVKSWWNRSQERALHRKADGGGVLTED